MDPPPVALRVALLTQYVPPFDDTIGPQNEDFDLRELVPALTTTVHLELVREGFYRLAGRA
jgi:hypothetical protein